MSMSPTGQRLLPPPRNKAEMRRSLLAEIDNAEFTRFHTRIVLTSGAGFFTDAYDLFAINLCADMIGQVYSANGQLTPAQALGLKIAAPVGNMVGQVVFGWLADRYGRNKIYGVELIIMLSATFAQVMAGDGRQLSIFSSMIIFRFIMGIGIGGDYPLSAVLTSEFAAVRFRGRMMSAVVAMQGFGTAAAAIVSLIVTAAFQKALLNSPKDAVDRMWRIIIAIGMIPGLAALYSRLTIPESPRFTLDVERNLDQAARDADFVQNGRFDVIADEIPTRIDVPEASKADFFEYFSRWANLSVLIGCAWSWFVADVSFYGLGLNPEIIFNIVGYDRINGGNPTTPQDIYDHLYHTCVGNTVIAVAGLIPGYWATFFLIDKWGRKPIQLMGFAVLTVLFATLGFGYDRITHGSPTTFAVLYALAYNFQNFGPNVTTWVIPGELFVTRYRVLCDGISAASGKLGAVLAQLLFYYTKDIGGGPGDNAFFKHILEIIAFLMITGIISTLLVPETMGHSLEYLAGEEEGEDNFGPQQDMPRANNGLLSSLRDAVNLRPRTRTQPIELETI